MYLESRGKLFNGGQNECFFLAMGSEPEKLMNCIGLFHDAIKIVNERYLTLCRLIFETCCLISMLTLGKSIGPSSSGDDPYYNYFQWPFFQDGLNL